MYVPYHREVVVDLIEEYKAAERPDYVNWGGSSGQPSQAAGAGADAGDDF